MDVCVVLLILIITVAAVLVFYTSRVSSAGVIGGAALIVGGRCGGSCGAPDKTKKIFIGDRERLVIDGHNMIHMLIGNKEVNVLSFERALKDISAMLIVAFPTQDKHIVLKNPPEKHAAMFKKIKGGKRMPYFQELVKISKEFPSITYHLAYGKPPKKNSAEQNHHLRGRDDFLSIMLAKGAYVVSQDRFRDFKQFSTISPFKHYSVTAGKIHPTRTIKPINEWQKLDPPTIGNHFIYKIVDIDTAHQLGVENGSIYLTDKSEFGCMYIVRPKI